MKMNTSIRTVIVLLAIMFLFSGSGWAQDKSAPVVGGAIMAVNVDVVATSGYRASKLLGDSVYNKQGEKIGTLDEIIIASDQMVSIGIVAVGGFLGVGARNVAVPATLFERNDQGQTVLPEATKDVLMALPEFRYAE